MFESSKKDKNPYVFKEINLLIMEEHPFMADLVSSMLKAFGVGKVYQTCDIEQAQKILNDNITGPNKNSIDFIITDLLPPGNEGLSLLKWVRHHENRGIKFMPVLFSSIYTTRQVVFRGRDLGANEILVKPFTAEKIARRLLHMIDRPRPFVKAPNFIGPDRRRLTLVHTGQDRRVRKTDDIVITLKEQDDDQGNEYAA